MLNRHSAATRPATAAKRRCTARWTAARLWRMRLLVLPTSIARGTPETRSVWRAAQSAARRTRIRRAAITIHRVTMTAYRVVWSSMIRPTAASSAATRTGARYTARTARGTARHATQAARSAPDTLTKRHAPRIRTARGSLNTARVLFRVPDARLMRIRPNATGTPAACGKALTARNSREKPSACISTKQIAAACTAATALSQRIVLESTQQPVR